MYYGHMSGFWFGGFFWMILFWGAVIWFIIWLISKSSTQKKTPLQTAKERYAKGELSKKEYDTMKKELIGG